jgi:hypothetical protein
VDEGKLDRLIALMLAREEREARDASHIMRPASTEHPTPHDAAKPDPIGAAGLLRRLGWRRGEKAGIELNPRGQLTATVGDYRHSIVSPGDPVLFWSNRLPAGGAGTYNATFFVPPAGGAWVLGWRNMSSTDRVGMVFQHLIGWGSPMPNDWPTVVNGSQIIFMPDGRESSPFATPGLNDPTGMLARRGVTGIYGNTIYVSLNPNEVTWLPHPFYWADPGPVARYDSNDGPVNYWGFFDVTANVAHGVQVMLRLPLGYQWETTPAQPR